MTWHKSAALDVSSLTFMEVVVDVPVVVEEVVAVLVVADFVALFGAFVHSPDLEDVLERRVSRAQVSCWDNVGILESALLVILHLGVREGAGWLRRYTCLGPDGGLAAIDGCEKREASAVRLAILPEH